MLSSIGMSKKNKNCSKELTVIELELFDPSGRKYPKFDYEDIKKKIGIENDSADDELRDPDAEAIVKRLEAKYGTGTIGGSKKRKNVCFAPEDVMDKGIGYDLTDTFIDDSEAYDEWVPSTMDTAKSGYYVNKGTLEFKYIDSDELDEKTDTSEMDEESDKDEQEEDLLSLTPIPKSNNNNNMTNNIVNKPALVSKSETSNFSSIVRLSQGGVPPSRRILSSEFKKTDFS